MPPGVALCYSARSFVPGNTEGGKRAGVESIAPARDFLYWRCQVDINIGMTRDRAYKFFRDGLAAVEQAIQDEGAYDVTEYGVANDGTRAEITLQISNDDMEDRPEVADVMLVDVDA